MWGEEHDQEFETLRQTYKTLKSQVEYVLQRYPSSRNLDELLWWLVFVKFYPDLAREFGECARKGYIPQELLKKVPKFGTISRIRRKFNEQGLYLPDDPTILGRRKRFERHWKKLMVEED